MFRILCLLVTCALTASADQRLTAFRAYSNVPRAAALRLAKVAACEGLSQPKRWHFIVHEPQAENGLRDYVIADGQLVATNEASQFAEEVHLDDVLALGSVRIDSGYVAQMAAQYAAANQISIATMNYDLHKDPASGPIWKVTCLNPSNRTLGWLEIDAGSGKVVRQRGFVVTPDTPYSAIGEPTAPRPDLIAPADDQRPPPPVASAPPGTRDSDLVDNAPSEQGQPSPALSEPSTARDSDGDAPGGGFHRPSIAGQPGREVRPPGNLFRDTEVRRAEPIEREPPQRRKFMGDLFRPGRRLFPF